MSKDANIGVRPTVMPVDREHWKRELGLSNFLNAYAIFRDISTLPDCRKILNIGPGQGLDVEVMKWRGYEVTTIDIDPVFSPDVVGSVNDMKMFENKQFDIVIASHVLEHLPPKYLDSAISEISRTGRYALIYLPCSGIFLKLSIETNFRGLKATIIASIARIFSKPDKQRPKYMEGQHYWEVGVKGFTKIDLLERFREHFSVRKAYRNKLWPQSMNYVLKSK